jgi:7-carboxy-7-deazaguanine synthase
VRIAELYRTVQGETTYTGLPCVIVRLAGCNLDCSYCDTPYAKEAHEGEILTVEEVLERIMQFSISLVCITGGEPLLQPEAPVLAQALLDRKFTVLVETNGTLDISALPHGTIVILDIKCPGSNMAAQVRWENIAHLKASDEIKFVIANRDDYEWALDVVRKFQLVEKTPVLFSPAFGQLAPETLAQWILDDRLAVRLNLQLHKYVWPRTSRSI